MFRLVSSDVSNELELFFFLSEMCLHKKKISVKGYTLFCRSNTIRPILCISIQNLKCHNSICTYRSKFFCKTLLSSCSETQFSFFDIAVHVFLSNILSMCLSSFYMTIINQEHSFIFNISTYQKVAFRKALAIT